MIENKEFEVRYFNGKSAIPEKGVAFISSSSFIIKIKDQNLKFPFDSFHQVERIHNGIKLTLHKDENVESPTFELLCGLEESKEFEKIWISHKRGENLFQSISLFFRNLNPLSVVTVGLVFITVLGLSYFTLLQKIYIFFPEEVDDKLGNNFDDKIQKSFPLCSSEETNHFFSLALNELVPKNSKFKYKVRVINLPEENAISLAGGRIYFFSGLLNSSESQDEIVGVLAHEISHIEKRHHLRSMIKAVGTSFAISLLVGPGLGDFQTLETLTEIGSTIAVLKYSRDFETEADQNSYLLLSNANRDASGLLQFLKRMHGYENSTNLKLKAGEKKSNNLKHENGISSKIKDNIIDLLSSHPPTEDRILATEKILKERGAKPARKTLVSAKEWEKIKYSCRVKKN